MINIIDDINFNNWARKMTANEPQKIYTHSPARTSKGCRHYDLISDYDGGAACRDCGVSF